jgi:hypothetical protein
MTLANVLSRSKGLNAVPQTITGCVREECWVWKSGAKFSRFARCIKQVLAKFDGAGLLCLSVASVR